jgi:hypothetical protein
VSCAVLEAPNAPPGSPHAGARRGLGGRKLTLEERLHGVWRAAQRSGVAECPICRATVRPDGAAARCEGCGSVVS